MLNIHNLERRWLIYKIKSYIPYAAAIFLLVLLAIIGNIWLSSEETHVLKSSQPESAEKPTSSSQETAMILEPSMEFIHAVSESSPAVTSLPTTENKQIAIPISKSVAPLPAPIAKTLLLPDSPPIISKTQPSPPSKKGISINRDESTLDITEVANRFKETSNPNLGLFIARYYYDHGAYAEAYNYALKTNAINSRIDESWIIFSKSLIKLGKIDQAKKTLQLYSAQSGSDAAKGLLDSIEKGNFK